MSKKKEVIIIGGGVIGCSIAYHLAKRGIPSQIIERDSIGARASGKAWGVLTYPLFLLGEEMEPDGLFTMPGETCKRWLAGLFQSSFHRMADIALDLKERGGIDIEFGEFPSVLAAHSESDDPLLKEFLSALRELGGYEYEWLEPDELKAIFPTLRRSVGSGLSMPFLQVEPYKYTLGLAQAAETMGATVRQGDVVGFDTKGKRITTVKLASGASIEADEVVIAMGPWARQATSWLGKEIPLHIVMEECLCLEPQKGYPLHSLLLVGGEIGVWFAVISKVNGQVIVAEAEVESPSHYWDLKTRHNFEDRLSEMVKEKNLEAASKLMTDLEEAKLVEHRGDLLAYGPGPYYHRPIMGRLPEWENGYVATGFGANGIYMSLGAGEVMADLIADGQAPFRARRMLEHLSPARL